MFCHWCCDTVNGRSNGHPAYKNTDLSWENGQLDGMIVPVLQQSQLVYRVARKVIVDLTVWDISLMTSLDVKCMSRVCCRPTSVS